MYLILFDQHHTQVNPKAAESLADPEEYPNLFEDWQVGLAIESKVSETRFHYVPSVLLISLCIYMLPLR